MREVVVDTETTGLDPTRGDRLVEIGAIEIVNQIMTGAHFHVLINPEREVPDEAYRIHGHSTASLRDKPLFSSVVDEFLSFIGQDPLVIHNAEFDVRFLNAELSASGRPGIALERVVDTLSLARRKHPGAPASLDALCDRYRIDRSRRIKHGALLDAEILVDVYVELTGGRQTSLLLSNEGRPVRPAIMSKIISRIRSASLPPRIAESETRRHSEHIATLGDGVIWARYGYPG